MILPPPSPAPPTLSLPPKLLPAKPQTLQKPTISFPSTSHPTLKQTPKPAISFPSTSYPTTPKLAEKPTPQSQPCDAGLQFRQKLHFLQTTLDLNPFHLLTLNPALRTTPVSALHSNLTLLLSYHLTIRDISTLHSTHPTLLTSPPLANLQFLIGPAQLPAHLLRRCILNCPRLLSASVPDTLYPSLVFLKKTIRLHRPFTPVVTSILTYSLERTLIPKVEFLCTNLELSKCEVFELLRRNPAILTYGIESNLKVKIEFLREVMGRGVEDVRMFPQYFSFSLEKRIRPRFESLKRKGVEMSLPEMLRISDGEFQSRLLERWLGKVDEML